METEGDDAALAEILRRFARWQAVRAILQFLTFAAAAWALAAKHLLSAAAATRSASRSG